MADFSSQLKKLRKQKGLTQEELAKLLGKRKTTISNYEIGYSKPSYETLERLAQIFDVSIDIITGRTTSVKENPIDVLGRIELPMISPETDKTLQGAVSISRELVGGGDFFIVRLEDDALDASNLGEGDFVLCKHQNDVEDGTLAAVRIKEKTIAIRYFYRAEGKATLVSSGKNPPAIYDEKDVTVLGVAVKAFISL